MAGRKRAANGGASAAKRHKPAAYGTISAGAMAAISKKAAGYVRSSGYYGRFGKGGELKFFDTANAFNLDSTGEVPATGQLVLIPQGVTESTRVGRECIVKSIQMRGIMTYVPSTAATASSTGYLWVILDKQTNGAAAGVTDVFTGNSMGLCLHNLENSKRFVILKKLKHTFTSPAGVSTAYNDVTWPFEFFLKCNIPLDFSSTTGAITELRSNNIFLIAGSDTRSDDLIACSATTRIRFSDKS